MRILYQKLTNHQTIHPQQKGGNFLNNNLKYSTRLWTIVFEN